MMEERHGGWREETGNPLDTFTKSMPPGWRPNVAKYPLRRYSQLLKLWWRQTDLPETAAGPAMAGRLRGTAFQLAMALRGDRLDVVQGVVRMMVGDELLSQASHAAWQDPQIGQQFPEAPAGATVLLAALQAEYGVQDQDMSISSLLAVSLIRQSVIVVSLQPPDPCKTGSFTPTKYWTEVSILSPVPLSWV